MNYSVVGTFRQLVPTHKRLSIPLASLPKNLAIPLVLIIAIFATNHALSFVPNVKIFDLIVFAAGYSLGLRRGVIVATGAWLLYGTFNPWGVAGPLLLTTLMTAEVFYVLAGVVTRKIMSPNQLNLLKSSNIFVFGTAAIISTLCYDLITNIYTGIMWAQMSGGEYQYWVITAVFNPGALLFSGWHLGSNLVLFSLFGPSVAKLLDLCETRLP